MEKRNDCNRGGTLNHLKTRFSRLLGSLLVLKSTALVVVIGGLSSCETLSPIPSTFPPDMQTQRGTPPSAPAPSSSPSQPSGGSGQPQPNSGSQSPVPTPSLPSPSSPTSGSPSLPQPPNPFPSPESSNGQPSMPSIPTPGTQESQESGDVNQGTTTPESSSSGEGQQQSEQGDRPGGEMESPASGDMSLPPGDSTGRPADEESEETGGGTMLPGEESGSEDGWESSNQLPDPNANENEDGGGWESSNQLPDPNAGDGTEDETGEDDEELDGTDGTGEDAMQEVLGELDGEILEERNAENSRVNDELAADGSFESVEGDEGSGNVEEDEDGGDQPADEVEQEATDGVGEVDEPLLPETQAIAADTPDARDEEVVARQLMEAALAEEDPDVRKKLMDEYETYRDGLK